MNQEQFNKSMQTTKNYVDSTIQDYIGGKKQVYLTQAEYDLLSELEKNDATKVYNITDATEQVIPTKTSQLTNDSDYATNASVDEKIASVSAGGIVPTTQVEPSELDVPRLYFYGDALPTTKDNVNLEMDYKSNTMKFHSYVKLKCQGTSSMNYAKKNFTLALYEDADRSIKLKKNFKGWGEQNKFCLKANWVDSTHTRNISGARIAYDMVASRPDSPFKQELLKCPRNGVVDGFPIKVYFNGEFWGLYTWNIPKDAWMFNMSDDNPNHMVLCAETNNNGDMSVTYSTQFRKLWSGNDGDEWSIEVGTLAESLKNSFNNAINFVMTASDEEFKANISNYFDLYSLIDYYLFSYLTCHYDGLGKNMLMATYDGIHWVACLYDMDSIFGAVYTGASFMVADRPCPSGYQETNSLLWQRIEQCFADELKARYAELRKGALSLGNIITHVEEIYDLVSDRVFADDRARWTGLPSVATNTMTRFRNYMRDRAKYVDEQIAKLGVSIKCESLTLNETDLKLGKIEGAQTTPGTTPDTNINLIADATWQLGSVNQLTGAISSSTTEYNISYEITVPGVYMFAQTGNYTHLKVVNPQDSLKKSHALYTNNGASITFKVHEPMTLLFGAYAESGIVNENISLNYVKSLSDVDVKNKTIAISNQSQISINSLSSGASFGNKIIEVFADVTYKDIVGITFNGIDYKVVADETITNPLSANLIESMATNNYVVAKTYGGKSYFLIVVSSEWGSDATAIYEYMTSHSINNIVLNSDSVLASDSTSTTRLTYQLVATPTPSNVTDTIEWSVSPEGIVTVEDGKVTAVTNGECVVTATCGEQSATCTVNVSGLSQQSIQ